MSPGCVHPPLHRCVCLLSTIPQHAIAAFQGPRQSVQQEPGPAEWPCCRPSFTRGASSLFRRCWRAHAPCMAVLRIGACLYGTTLLSLLLLYGGRISAHEALLYFVTQVALH